MSFKVKELAENETPRDGLVQLTTSNGMTVSIGFGPYHHCDAGSETVEVAILCNGEFIYLPHDVAGGVPAENIPHIISAVLDEDGIEVCRLCKQAPEGVEGLLKAFRLRYVAKA